MSVHQKKDGRWFVAYKTAGRQKTKHFGRGLESEKQARAFNESLGLRSWARRTPPVNAVQFSELVNEYAAAKAGQFPKESMDNFLWKMAGVVMPALGHLPVMRLTDRILDKYVQRRLKSVKATTVHRELTDIQAVLNWGAGRRYIPYNPVAGYEKPRRDDEIIRPPSPDEIDAIIRHAPDHLARSIVLSYYTGLRPGCRELFSLAWDDINFADRTILIRSAHKGGLRSRIVPLHPDLERLMLAWPVECKYLICWRKQPVKSIKKAWATAKRKAGVNRRLRPYDLRHAFATYALRARSDLKATSELLGHSRVDTTSRIYYHTDYVTHQSVIDSLPSLGAKKENEK